MRYAALFRGINVGSKNPVRMADLEQLLSNMGLSRVKTYLRSGNAVFETALDEPALTEKIRAGFYGRFGFESGVKVRSAAQLRALAEGLPFAASEIAEAEAADPAVEHLYVYFLDRPPDQNLRETLLNLNGDGDRLAAGSREIYLLFKQSVRLSKAAARLAKACPDATARNWNTVLALRKLTDEA